MPENPVPSSSAMRTRALGDRRVSAIGLGCWPMSREGRPPRERSIATIHAALDAGVTLLDTADSYHIDPSELGHNERLVAEALRGSSARADVVIATKGGLVRPGDGRWLADGRPEHLVAAAEGSLRRLEVDAIDLYFLHRVDPAVPYSDSLGALRALVDRGVVRGIGLSNVDSAQIALAAETLGGALVAVQNRLSPSFQLHLPELATCDGLGVTFQAHSPLGGPDSARDRGIVASIAEELHETPAAICLAWSLALSERVIPIPGATTPERAIANAGAIGIELTRGHLARIATHAA